MLEKTSSINMKIKKNNKKKIVSETNTIIWLWYLLPIPKSGFIRTLSTQLSAASYVPDTDLLT